MALVEKRATLLDMGKMLKSVTTDEICGGPQMEDKSDEEYAMRLRKENRRVAKPENIKYVASPYTCSWLADIPVIDFRPS